MSLADQMTGSVLRTLHIHLKKNPTGRLSRALLRFPRQGLTSVQLLIDPDTMLTLYPDTFCNILYCSNSTTDQHIVNVPVNVSN